MSARRMTRRSLLAATAAAAAGGLVRPRGVLAALLGPPPRPELQARWLGRVAPGVTPTIELTRVADLVGVQWQAPGGAGVELRFRVADGSWGRWVSAGRHGHGPDAPAAGSELVGDPVWTGGTSALQLRSPHGLDGVRLHLVDVSGGVGARRAALAGGPPAGAAALALATPVLHAGPGQPPILARRAWAQGMAPPRVTPEYGAVRMAFVHHTENPNGYSPGEVPAMLRAIYVFHRYVNGWNDIGYNFVVDLYGRIFEARAGGIDEPVVGAHAGGYNLVSTGVAVLGSFMSAPISSAARAALERLLAWKLALHGLSAVGSVTVRVNPAGASYSRFPANARVGLPRIAGHRDGDSTDCPGNALYGELPGIRAAVHGLAPRPVRATLALSAAPAPSPTGAPSAPGSTGAPSAPGSTGAPSAPGSTGAPSAPGSTGAPAAPGPTSVQPAPSPTGAPAAPGEQVEAPAPTPTLMGALAFLDGTPIAGAKVLLQARTTARKGELVTEQSIAEALTDEHGQWSLPTSLPGARSGPAWVRALCVGAGGYGASVSAPLRVALTPAQAPAPTPPAAGSPAA